jgi:NTE family protein
MERDIRLVLSSGGARGLAQIGAIKALEEHGFRVRSVCGSSIGSLIGGLYAMNKLDDYAEWVTTLDMNSVWGLMDFSLTGKGLIKGEKVFDKMNTFIPDVNIEDMEIPFVAVATDIIHRKEVVFDKGSFYEAVRASIAIPALITPVQHSETVLVDGGVLHPLPFAHVRPVENSLLVAINLYSNVDDTLHEDTVQNQSHDDESKRSVFMNLLLRIINTRDKKSLGYLSMLSNISTIMLTRIAQLSIEIYKPDIVINVPADSAGTFEFYKAEELIVLGKTLGEKAIATYLKNQVSIKS